MSALAATWPGCVGDMILVPLARVVTRIGAGAAAVATSACAASASASTLSLAEGAPAAAACTRMLPRFRGKPPPAVLFCAASVLFCAPSRVGRHFEA
mgnify:CR=1 FL=1